MNLVERIVAAVTPTKDAPQGALARMILGGKPCWTGVEVAQLRKLDDEYQNALNERLSHTPDSAKRIWLKQDTSHGQLARSGMLPGAAHRSLDSLLKEYEEKGAAAGRECFSICAEAFAITLPIIRRFPLLADEFIAKREAQEREEAKTYSLAYEPSPVLRSAVKLTAACRWNFSPPGYGHMRPLAQIPFFFES